MHRTSSAITHWFFTECSAPTIITNPPSHLPAGWEESLGKPDARFPSSKSCDLAAKLNEPHNVIMNIDFCGLAQGYWEEEGCLAVAPDCYSWAKTPDATRYYRLEGQSVDFDIARFSYYEME